MTFKDGATTLGTGTLTAGAATFSTATLAVGPHSITAIYGGDTNDAAATSSAIAVTVQQLTTAVTLSTSNASPTIGTSVTLMATLSPSAATGTVTFKDGATTLGTANVSGGAASFSTSALTIGSHTLTASYGGDANDVAATSPPIAVVVQQQQAALALAASSSAVNAGSSVTFTATATPASATGTVTFKDGATTLGASALAGGQASFSTSSLSPGAHSITAVYGGDASDTTAISNAVAINIQQSGTTTTLKVSSTAPTFGSPVTFTATVSPSTATGTITFKDGATTLATGALAAGTVSFSTTTLALGAHTITAVYSGDAADSTSTSAPSQIAVGARLALVTQTLVQPVQGAPYSQTIASSGGTQPVTCAITGGALPAGLVLNGAACVISGVPTGGLGFSVAITLTDANGVTVTQVFGGAVARSSPANDPGVIGVQAAQFASAMSYARTQLGMIHSRLDQSHDGDDSDACENGGDVCMLFDNGLSVRQVDPPRSRESNDQQQLSRQLDPQTGRQTSASGLTRIDNLLALDSATADAVDRSKRIYGDVTATDYWARNFSAKDQAGRDYDLFGALPKDRNSLTFSALRDERGAGSTPGTATRSRKSYLTPFTIRLWTSGSVEVGRYSTSIGSFGQKLDNRAATRGVAFGAETRLWPGLKAGVAFGFGVERTDVGTDGSHSSATGKSVSLYASQRLWPGVFLDGVVGAADMLFRAHRLSYSAGSWIDGQRHGTTYFGSVSLTSEQKWQGLKFAPFVRLSAIQAKLDAYSEIGDPNWALSYDQARARSLDATAGVRLGYDLPMWWGVLTPSARLQYQRLITGAATQAMSYTIDPTAVYAMTVAGQGSWMIQGAIGVQARIDNGVSGGLEATTSAGGSGRRGLGLRGNMKYQF